RLHGGAASAVRDVRGRSRGRRVRPVDDALRGVRLEVEAAVRSLSRRGRDPGPVRRPAVDRLVPPGGRDRSVRRTLLKSYEGQIKIFLVLLVLFLAITIYFNVHLLTVARNAIQEEVGRRLGLEAALLRVQLERDQMLRGLRAGPGAVPYIPPTFLDRMS